MGLPEQIHVSAICVYQFDVSSGAIHSRMSNFTSASPSATEEDHFGGPISPKKVQYGSFPADGEDVGM